MDLNILYQLFENKKLTDLELILKDNINSINICVHKLVLYVQCPFFQKFFDRFFRSKMIGRSAFSVIFLTVFQISRSIFPIKNIGWSNPYVMS